MAGLVVILTVPALYEKYEEHFDKYVMAGYGSAVQFYSKLSEGYISKVQQWIAEQKKLSWCPTSLAFIPVTCVFSVTTVSSFSVSLSPIPFHFSKMLGWTGLLVSFECFFFSLSLYAYFFVNMFRLLSFSMELQGYEESVFQQYLSAGAKMLCWVSGENPSC